MMVFTILHVILGLVFLKIYLIFLNVVESNLVADYYRLFYYTFGNTLD